MPMSPKAFDWENSETEKYRQDGTRSHHGVTAHEWKLSLLRLSQIYLMFGRHLWSENKPNEALSHFQSARYYADQFCRMKRQFASSNHSGGSRTSYLSIGSMITLSDFLKVYEQLGQYDRYLQLVTACIGYLETDNGIDYPKEYFEDVYGDRPEIKILDLSDLHCFRAHILMKQSGFKLTDAYQDLRKAISVNPKHSETNKLMSILINLSDNFRETACLMILKGCPREAMHYIKTAIMAQPEKAKLHFDQASLLRRLGQLDGALESILQGVHLLQSHGDKDDQEWFRRNSLYELFYILLDMSMDKLLCGQPGLALSLLDNLKTAAPRNILIHVLQGDCRFGLEDFQQALELYQKGKALLDEFKNSQHHCTCKFLELYDNGLNTRISQTLYLTSLVKIKNKQFEEALNSLALCVQLFPLIPQYYVIRTRLNYQCNRLEDSWRDLMTCIYLYLSDASLMKRTKGEWARLPDPDRHTIRQHLTKQVRDLIGPVLNRLMPKAHNLVHLANSRQCFLIAQQIINLMPGSRCKWCGELANPLNSPQSSTVALKQIKSNPSSSSPGQLPPISDRLTSASGGVDSILHSNVELKMIKNDILKLRKIGKV